MAHYKRHHSRTSSQSHGSSRGYWLHHWPKWHDILFHNRPRRRREAGLLRRVIQGYDPDAIAWPVSRKPHAYYW
jgi:hypothetical protein